MNAPKQTLTLVGDPARHLATPPNSTGASALGLSPTSSFTTTSTSKILSLPDLLAMRDQARAAGRKVVQCHGCFDIVHPGHLRHLRHARAQGDLLLVTITGDALIDKGLGRPLIPQELRAENLAALECVDWVYIDNRPTAAELLEDVRPDVFVKGREYELNDDPRFHAERDTVTRHGGRVVFSSGDVVFSSTALIAALEHSVDPYHARLLTLLRDPALDAEQLSRTIMGFAGKRVVVVGETIIDTYIHCDRPDVAGESPVMTLRPIDRRAYDGGAAIIARHLAALGACPVLVTALDDSEESSNLRRRLLADGIEVHAVRAGRALPEKQRFLIGAQKVMKLDLVQRYELDAAAQSEFVQLVSKALKPTERGEQPSDACIIADFGLGLITQGLLPRLAQTARAGARIVSGDVSGKRSHLLDMHAFDLLCPSESEIREACRQFDQSLTAVAWELLEHTGARHAIVTMGPDGLVAFDRLPNSTQPGWHNRLKAEHVPALSAMAIDALGCGDALIAVATLALSTGAPLLQASFLGAVAAGVQVQRLGNTVISAPDLRHSLARLHSAHLAFASAEVLQSRPTAGAGARVVGGQASRLSPVRLNTPVAASSNHASPSFTSP